MLDFLFTKIINTIDDLVLILNDNIIIEANNKSLSEFGSNIINSPISELIPDNLDSFLEFISGNETSKNFIFNNKKIYSCKFITHVEFIILFCSDIEKYYLLNEQNNINKYKFDVLFNNESIGNAILDLDMSFIELNSKISILLGYEFGELNSMNLKNIIYKSDIDLYNEILNKIKSKNNYYGEIRLVKKSGLYIWTLITISSYNYKNNTIYYILNIQDISEQKYYQEKIQKTEERYRALIHKSFHAIVYKKLIYDKSGNIIDYIIIDANPTFERVTGFKLNEIIGRPMKMKAAIHFNVSDDENNLRLQRYDRILKDNQDIHYKSQPSRTFKYPIDVYYYILNKDENIIAVVFGDEQNDREIILNL